MRTYDDLPETLDPFIQEDLSEATKARWTKDTTPIAIGAVAIDMAQAFPDGHYSGSPNFSPSVYGAD